MYDKNVCNEIFLYHYYMHFYFSTEKILILSIMLMIRIRSQGVKYQPKTATPKTEN